MGKVVVFGSLNMDLCVECEAMPKAGETVAGHSFFTNPGGKGANQAVAAARLGAPTCMIGRVGSDLFGTELAQNLLASGVDTAQVKALEGLSTGIAVITTSKGENRIVLSAGANHAMDAAETEAALRGLAGPGDVLVTQHESRDEAVWQALQIGRELGMFTIHNPAPAKTIPIHVYPCIDLLVANQTECEYLTGIYPETAEDCQRAVALLKSYGAGEVIITLGGEGSVGSKRDTLIEQKSIDVDVVDTTAAGDTYIGALAASWLRGEPIEQGMAFATWAACYAITKQGAQQSIPDLKALENFMQGGER